MSSAAEAELGALYLNAMEAIYLRQILHKIGQKQPHTPILTDNTTAKGIINNKIQPKRTKAMDMRFHWLRDCEAQGQFKFTWKPGKTNLADYFTKHHPPAHHVNVRSELLTKVRDLTKIRSQNTGKQNKPHRAHATTSYKDVLDSQVLHTISSEHFSDEGEFPNLNSPRGRFLSDKFLGKAKARLEIIIILSPFHYND
jgi:hypothetical protein